MAQVISWDDVGERFYETGVDRGVLYIPDVAGDYTNGIAWNGLTSVSEAPTGAEANPQYADNTKYLNLISIEEFEASLEAFTWPSEFEQFEGVVELATGLKIGQQTRTYFGLCYRTLVGNDQLGTDAGYKLHLIYGATASPTEKAYSTVNDSPEPITFSWELTTTPVAVPGRKPTASAVVDSREADSAALAALEAILYGDDVGPTDPRMPFPAELITLLTP